MSIGILSWGARKTLVNTLESYKKYNLDDADKIIYFQEISGEDISIAKEYGYRYIGGSTNIGIGKAYAELVSEARGEFFLFLENDWTLIENPHMELYAAEILLYNNVIDVVRLRHRQNPGHPLWTRQFEGHEMDRPTHLLDSVHWCSPSLKFPELISRRTIEFGYGDDTVSTHGFFTTSSKYANWTNNPTLSKTEWLRKNIVERVGSADLEKNIQGWWEQQDFTVAQGEGLFTHGRID